MTIGEENSRPTLVSWPELLPNLTELVRDAAFVHRVIRMMNAKLGTNRTFHELGLSKYSDRKQGSEWYFSPETQYATVVDAIHSVAYDEETKAADIRNWLYAINGKGYIRIDLVRDMGEGVAASPDSMCFQPNNQEPTKAMLESYKQQIAFVDTLSDVEFASTLSERIVRMKHVVKK